MWSHVLRVYCLWVDLMLCETMYPFLVFQWVLVLSPSTEGWFFWATWSGSSATFHRYHVRFLLARVDFAGVPDALWSWSSPYSSWISFVLLGFIIVPIWILWVQLYHLYYYAFLACCNYVTHYMIFYLLHMLSCNLNAMYVRYSKLLDFVMIIRGLLNELL